MIEIDYNGVTYCCGFEQIEEFQPATHDCPEVLADYCVYEVFKDGSEINIIAEIGGDAIEYFNDYFYDNVCFYDYFCDTDYEVFNCSEVDKRSCERRL